MPKSDDPNQRTGEDMARARAGTSIDVGTVRDYLYGELRWWLYKLHMSALFVEGNVSGGRPEWNTHNKVAQMMSQDPVFDKSQMSVLIFVIQSHMYLCRS